MATIAPLLTHSRYYSPAFNSAIFDGPIRIYFSQSQEPAALKVYFHLKERERSTMDQLRSDLSLQKRNVFVLLYPSSEAFSLVFSDDEELEVMAPDDSIEVVVEHFEQDFVLGVKGPLEDDLHLSLIQSRLGDIQTELVNFPPNFIVPLEVYPKML